MQLSIAKIFIGIFLFFGFLYIAGNMEDPDLGWHLRVGEKILVDKTVPHFDEYSWTMLGFEWVNHEWSVDALLALMDSYNLWFVTIFLFAIFAFAPFAIWIKRSDNFAHLLVVILAATSIISFVGVRPQIISFLLFFIVFEILYRLNLNNNNKNTDCFVPRNDRNKNKFMMFLLSLIFLIWANLHAGFFAGLIIFGLFIVSKKWILKDSSPILRMTTLFIFSSIATFINPYGWKLYKEIFTVILSSDTMRYIAEWLPIFSKFNFILILYLGIFFALILIFRKKYQPVYLLIPAFFALAAVKSARNWPMFLVVSMPVLFSGIDFVKEEIKAAQNKKPLNRKTRMILRNISIVAFVFIIIFFGYRLYKYDAMEFPDKATEFLNDKIESGQWQDVKLLNTYGWGGYLINNAPNTKVFIDGRMPHWVDENGDSAMKDYIKIFYSKNTEDWKEVFSRRGIEVVLIENKNNTSPKKSFLEDNFPDYFEKIKQFLRSKKSIMRANEILNGKSAINLKDTLLANGWAIEYEDEVTVILRRQGAGHY